jgi:hypothetical protein
MAVEVGDLDTLDAARKIVAELLRAGGPVEPGDLVRHHAADDQEGHRS